ncbi:hypothetical protein [Microbacterium allomyrinae]|uniref:Uncharacterized protein n=1 Tax=Microbacterium allomyrinae TaxID=2830666 RepID=A0A9X1LS36_9MICO|nr:hypothetical protein [Microbacterium allomyrinae]MCC2030910.1 hypothetical protein [Microbacterium allomyrinae]
MAETFAQMRAMTDEELVKQHDESARNTTVGLAHYEDELRHRDLTRSAAASTRLAEESHRLARQSHKLTIANTVLSVVAVIVAIVALFVR